MINSNVIYAGNLVFAGGVGMFFEDLILKTIITTVALLVASTVVFYYKKWLEK